MRWMLLRARHSSRPPFFWRHGWSDALFGVDPIGGLLGDQHTYGGACRAWRGNSDGDGDGDDGGTQRERERGTKEIMV